MNKNTVIFFLVCATLLGSIWGSIANRERIELEKKYQSTLAEMQNLSALTSREREQVLGKTAGLQDTLVEKEEQVARARKELVSLRKENKALEAELSGCNAAMTRIKKENSNLQEQLKATGESDDDLVEGGISPLDEGADEVSSSESSTLESDTNAATVAALRDQLQSARLTSEKLQQKLDAAQAQIIGLEKIVEEKSDAMDETSQEMDRLKINMDVLLSKIADQQDDLQELQEENRQLVKELAAKNEELSDLMEEMVRSPVRK